MWGSNESGKLGFESEYGEVQFVPRKVHFHLPIVDAAGGRYPVIFIFFLVVTIILICYNDNRSHTVIITNTGHVFTWGAMAWGQLGTLILKLRIPSKY